MGGRVGHACSRDPLQANGRPRPGIPRIRFPVHRQ